MKLAIMQPYFFPYIGYFQLINAVDTFVVYDNIKYTKKGWINRNRFLQNGTDAAFSISLKKDSDALDVRERVIADDFDRLKLLNQIQAAYRKAPYFEPVFALFSQAVLNDERNLFAYIHSSIREICAALGIGTKIVVSSTVAIDHTLKAQDKVLAICRALGADEYINAIGGQELYTKEAFREQGVALQFIKPQPIVYPQFGNEFVPWLSILDVMMFNSPGDVSRLLREHELI